MLEYIKKLFFSDTHRTKDTSHSKIYSLTDELYEISKVYVKSERLEPFRILNGEDYKEISKQHFIIKFFTFSAYYTCSILLKDNESLLIFNKASDDSYNYVSGTWDKSVIKFLEDIICTYKTAIEEDKREREEAYNKKLSKFNKMFDQKAITDE